MMVQACIDEETQALRRCGTQVQYNRITIFAAVKAVAAAEGQCQCASDRVASMAAALLPQPVNKVL